MADIIERVKKIIIEQLDVAEAVHWLCSEGARYVTGQVIHVNGGLYM